VALPPLAFAFWLGIPFFDPPLKTVQGRASPARYCLAGCSDVLKVSGQILGCKAEPAGLSFGCRDDLLASGDVVATYVRLPSLSSLLGVSRVSGTLVRLERGKELVYDRSVSSIVWASLHEPSLFHLLYWPIAAFIIWRWPRSRFSRRATWSDAER
jgi:hypothetical protein